MARVEDLGNRGWNVTTMMTESTPSAGRGSFDARVPEDRTPDDSGPEEGLTESGQRGGSTPSRRVSHSSFFRRSKRRFKVLVADDDERSLECLVALLDQEGFLIEPAHCGSDALSLLGLTQRERRQRQVQVDPQVSEEAELHLEVGRPAGRKEAQRPKPSKLEFDFLVVDYNMPDFTGVEVLRRCQAAFGGPLPAIMVSGDYSRELLLSWQQVGGFALLPKPIEPTDFRQQVWNLVHRFFGG